MNVINDKIIITTADVNSFSLFTREALSAFYGSPLEDALSDLFNRVLSTATSRKVAERAEILDVAGLEKGIVSADTAKQTQVLPLVSQIKTILER